MQIPNRKEQKKILRIFDPLWRLLITGIFLLLFIPSLCFAVSPGTITESEFYRSTDNSILIIKLSFVGDESNGTVADKTISKAETIYNFGKVGYYLYHVTVVPGTTIPPDAADLSIKPIYLDENGDAVEGTNYLATDGTDIINTTVKEGTPSLLSSAYKYPPVATDLKISVANQGTVDATWDAYLFFGK